MIKALRTCVCWLLQFASVVNYFPFIPHRCSFSTYWSQAAPWQQMFLHQSLIIDSWGRQGRSHYFKWGIDFARVRLFFLMIDFFLKDPFIKCENKSSNTNVYEKYVWPLNSYLRSNVHKSCLNVSLSTVWETSTLHHSYIKWFALWELLTWLCVSPHWRPEREKRMHLSDEQLIKLYVKTLWTEMSSYMLKTVSLLQII